MKDLVTFNPEVLTVNRGTQCVVSLGFRSVTGVGGRPVLMVDETIRSPPVTAFTHLLTSSSRQVAHEMISLSSSLAPSTACVRLTWCTAPSMPSRENKRANQVPFR